MVESEHRPVCAVARNQRIQRAVHAALSGLDIPDLNGKRILLKPNVGRNVRRNLGINTSPTVTNAVFQFLRKRFDATFFIGDSPILGVKTKEAFLSSGYGHLMNHRGLRFIDMDGRKPAVIPIETGRILKQVKVSGYMRDMDYIVSIPVLKMHMHTGASLSFKNMKGLLYKREKVRLHQLHARQSITRGFKELDIAIADLAHAMEPDLAVIDAYYAQEGMGPSAGSRKRMNTIIASTDYLAADITALAIAGLTIDHVPHLRLIAEGKPGVSSIGEIRTVPADIEHLKTDLELPPREIRVKNHMINLIDVGSCSACLSTIFLFVSNNESLIHRYFNEYGQLDLAVGKDIGDVPEGSIVIGNCASCQRNRGVFIKGCPPTQTLLRQAIEKRIGKKKG